MSANTQHTHTYTLPKAAWRDDAGTPPDSFLIHIQPLWIGDRDIWLVLALHRLLCTADTNSELDLTLQFPTDQQGWHNYYAGCATHRRRETHSGVIQLQPMSVGEILFLLFFFLVGELIQNFFFPFFYSLVHDNNSNEK